MSSPHETIEQTSHTPGGAGSAKPGVVLVFDAGKPAFAVELSDDERALSRPLFLLTDKPTIFACNVKESDLATADSSPSDCSVAMPCCWHTMPAG